METLFAPYYSYKTSDIVIEFLAVFFGIISVLYSQKNNVKVYPTGIFNTLLYVYLLYQWDLFGDMLINIYYFAMSIYGWYLWTHPNNSDRVLPITRLTTQDIITSGWIFSASILLVIGIYLWFDKFGFWWSYIDIFTTGLFCSGMFLLAKRKVEHWLFLLLGNIISIPLYYYKGYALTALLFILYSIIAILGYLEWKKKWLSKNS